MFLLNAAGQYKELVNLKQKNPNLKVSIAILGPYETFSNMAEKPEKRKAFIQSVLAFIK